jgi:hypothetical protein
MTEKLHEYFKRLEALGAPRATRLVTSLVNGVVTTELKDSDVELIELPACHVKVLFQLYLSQGDQHDSGEFPTSG